MYVPSFRYHFPHSRSLRPPSCFRSGAGSLAARLVCDVWRLGLRKRRWLHGCRRTSVQCQRGVSCLRTPFRGNRARSVDGRDSRVQRRPVRHASGTRRRIGEPHPTNWICERRRRIVDIDRDWRISSPERISRGRLRCGHLSWWPGRFRESVCDIRWVRAHRRTSHGFLAIRAREVIRIYPAELRLSDVVTPSRYGSTRQCFDDASKISIFVIGCTSHNVARTKFPVEGWAGS